MKRAFAIILAVLVCLFPRAQAKGRAAAQISAASAAVSDTPHNPRAGYVGDTACRSCHADQFASYHQTAHYRTSMLPSHDSILGSFMPGDNILKTANPNLFFRMEEQRVDGKEDGFLQTAVAGASPHTNTRSERFAVAVGSGEKGQTYLYWDQDQLFQLPVSFWTKLGWVNSPGYRDGNADFDRPIIPRCLECHASYFEAMPPPINKYKTAGFTLGIECEKCHGPGREHAEREKSKPPTSAASAILNPARILARSPDGSLRMVSCRTWPAVASVIFLRAGAPLTEYIDFPHPIRTRRLDVHGNQVELLKQSRCFRSSTMTCITCHDVHIAQHNLVDFSQKCLSCHKPDSATFARADHPLTKNCIDCHMPKQETNLIVFDWKGTTVRPEVRNHWIKIYPALKAAAVATPSRAFATKPT